jgi:basic membrane protein A
MTRMLAASLRPGRYTIINAITMPFNSYEFKRTERGTMQQLKRSSLIILSAAMLGLAGPAIADNFSAAIVYDTGGKFDKSFNESAFDGIAKFKKETGVEVREAIVNNETQREQVLRNMARKGAPIVVANGFSFTQSMTRVAAEFPKTKFVLIDAVVKAPNVLSVVFKEHEGSFIVGMAAAMASKTKKIGYINAMSMPLLNAFECGFVQGARFVDPKVQMISNVIGSTPSSFNDPGRGSEIAKSQFDRGADVVFAVAGPTGLGVFQAAKDAKKLAIGVDSNQNHIQPGTVLTSMIKRIDQAVYDALMAAKNGTWKPGLRAMGLKEGGVDWAVDQYNRKLITADMEKKINDARQKIIDGKIIVADYRDKNACPVH